jgi:hypothetical protein
MLSDLTGTGVSLTLHWYRVLIDHRQEASQSYLALEAVRMRMVVPFVLVRLTFCKLA